MTTKVHRFIPTPNIDNETAPRRLDHNLKLQCLRLLLVLFVVLIHTRPENVTGTPIDNTLSKYAHSSIAATTIIQQSVAGVAVPMFFAIAGFLFFHNLEPTWISWRRKIRSRWSSLVVPYLAWSMIYLIVIGLWQCTPWCTPDDSRLSVFQFSPSELLHRWVIDPIPGQLWFLRDLILLALISPLLWLFIRYFRGLFLLVMLTVWIVGWNAGYTRSVLSSTGLLFFSMGGFLAGNGFNASIEPTKKRIFLLVWALSIAIATVAPGEPLQHISTLCGICALWCNWDILRPGLEHPFAIALSRYAFFVYAGHTLFNDVIERHVLSHFWPSPGRFQTLALVAAATFFVLLWSAIGYVVRRSSTRLFAVLNGGRS